MSIALANSLESQIKQRAAEYGFDLCAITTPDAISGAGGRLAAFVGKGYHGEMSWLADTLQRRGDVRALWPECRSVIMLAANYGVGSERQPLERLEERDRGVIARYAKGRDYHDVIKGRLKQVAGALAALDGVDVKVFVDTAPLMEKPLAQAAGLGWQGKHTNLVSRPFGSWLFLGAILTSTTLTADEPEADHCGNCRRCLDVCPTDAFPAPYQLDARRCISYLTIEHPGHIAQPFRKAMGNRIFGCDDCLAVCPWNKFAQASREAKFAARAATDDPPLGELLELDDASFRQRFQGTPIKRTGRDRFLRNVLIAAGNSGDRAYLPQVRRLLADPSAIVRSMAVWAVGQLGATAEVAMLRQRHLPHETDDDVRAEWEHVRDRLFRGQRSVRRILAKDDEEAERS
ncbi:MAG: tRNA epoxyqueuosine(34) reductase QueG [Alphaproteobacteria bacterium]|nr:tRNA epoxyqueuosine(34) reductase QueG [Alphaproteobacteria bacterium]